MIAYVISTRHKETANFIYFVLGRIASGSTDYLFFNDEPDKSDTYTPLFVDKLQVTTTMNQICHGDSFCLLDFQATQNTKFASRTKYVNSVNTENKLNIGK